MLRSLQEINLCGWLVNESCLLHYQRTHCLCIQHKTV